MLRILLILRVSAAVCLVLPGISAENPREKSIPRPDEDELERTVGYQVDRAVGVAAWAAPEPQRTNLVIYSVGPVSFDEGLMRRVAHSFGLAGPVEPIRGETLGQIGFWIRELNPTNSAKSREVKNWLTISSFSYSAGDDGYRWDIKNHKPLVSGVPDKDEAKQKALDLLPLLGLSTNDLEHYPNGRIRWASSGPNISYTDRADKTRKTVVISRNVTFYQRVPNGGMTSGAGSGGQLRFSFVSDGKVASIECFFRNLVKAGEAKPKTSKDLMADLRRRNAWTWHAVTPDSLTVTNCAVGYPQANFLFDQQYVRPFYMVSGVGTGGEKVTFYVPMDW